MALGYRIMVFDSAALSDEEALLITRVEGHEALSSLYSFEIDLISNRSDLDIDALMAAPAHIGIKHGVPVKGGTSSLGKVTRKISGVLTRFQQLETNEGWTQYRCTLQPRLWKLSRFFRSRVYRFDAASTQSAYSLVPGSVPAIVESILKGAGLTAESDFVFQLGDPNIYKAREYVVQYQETDLDFINRWLEHEGIYYFFEQGDNGDRLVFADATARYQPIGKDLKLNYQPGALGETEQPLDAWFAEETVRTASMSVNPLVAEVKLRDYNWRNPRVDLGITQAVDDKGVGLQYEYNEHYKTPKQGAHLAKVRAEERLCRRVEYSGTSDCRTFRAGTVFELAQHPVSQFNRQFLLTSVHHMATQSFGMNSTSAVGGAYRNTYTCIPADVLWRPARDTDWPSIHGIMHGIIEGGTDYADIDKVGRYRVKLPFGLDDDPAGGVSRWIRMAQPYAGANYGMHFPLHAGVEVLLSHVDGDPDRPVIIGAVPNRDTMSPVVGQNSRRNTMRTSSGNQISFSDDANSTGILMSDALSSSVKYQGKKGGSGGGGGGGSSTAAARTPLANGPNAIAKALLTDRSAVAAAAASPVGAAVPPVGPRSSVPAGGIDLLALGDQIHLDEDGETAPEEPAETTDEEAGDGTDESWAPAPPEGYTYAIEQDLTFALDKYAEGLTGDTNPRNEIAEVYSVAEANWPTRFADFSGAAGELELINGDKVAISKTDPSTGHIGEYIQSPVMLEVVKVDKITERVKAKRIYSKTCVDRGDPGTGNASDDAEDGEIWEIVEAKHMHDKINLQGTLHEKVIAHAVSGVTAAAAVSDVTTAVIVNDLTIANTFEETVGIIHGELFVGFKGEYALSGTHAVTIGAASESFFGAVNENHVGALNENQVGAVASTRTGVGAEIITGNSSEVHTGNKTETLIGNQIESIAGNVTSGHVGNKTEFIVGTVKEGHIGNSQDINLTKSQICLNFDTISTAHKVKALMVKLN